MWLSCRKKQEMRRDSCVHLREDACLYNAKEDSRPPGTADGEL